MIQRLLLIGAVLAGMAVPAAAQVGFRLSFGGRHHGRNFEISIGARAPHPKHHGRSYRRGRDHRGRRHTRVGRGHYRYVTERVWVPGPRHRVYVPGRYGYRYGAFGRRVRYCIAEAHYQIVEEPGRWEYRRRQVWVGR